jgi:hypothetical protein
VLGALADRPIERNPILQFTAAAQNRLENSRSRDRD